MFWATLWALILGFLLSGFVQSFVTRDEMQRVMGDHRGSTIVRSGLLGMASSSCSYAATALSKSLFQRGADFTASIVFMIASTNLVIELGGMMSQSDMDALKKTSGPDSSKLFLQQMIQHHQGAIDMANEELTTGKNTDAIKLAKSIVSSQTAEIATMNSLLKSL